MEDSNMDTAGLCRTRFVWHVTRFDSSRSRLGLKMRIRIHLSTCSGDEDRTVLDLQIGSGKLDWQKSPPWGVLFSMSEESGGAVKKSIWYDWHCHIGIGSTLPTRHSTTRCRAYPVTENCRSDLSLTNGNLVTKSHDKMPEMIRSCRCYVYFWYFWIWCSFLWKNPMETILVCNRIETAPWVPGFHGLRSARLLSLATEPQLPRWKWWNEMQG